MHVCLQGGDAAFEPLRHMTAMRNLHLESMVLQALPSQVRWRCPWLLLADTRPPPLELCTTLHSSCRHRMATEPFKPVRV